MIKGVFNFINLFLLVAGSVGHSEQIEVSEFAAGFVRPNDFLCAEAESGAEGLVQVCIGSINTTLSRHSYQFVHLTFEHGQQRFSRTYPLDLLPEQAPDFHNLENKAIFIGYAIYQLDPLGSNYGSLVMIWENGSDKKNVRPPSKIIVYPPQQHVEKFEFTNVEERPSIQPRERP